MVKLNKLEKINMMPNRMEMKSHFSEKELRVTAYSLRA